jgi:hypothetical protein
VAYVTFEDRPVWRNAWIEETGVNDPLLVDPERTLYTAFGMQRSLLRSWSPRTVFFYLKARFLGKTPADTGADAHQLGGDFIVDTRRIVRFAGISRSPLDRPSMSEILETARYLPPAP